MRTRSMLIVAVIAAAAPACGGNSGANPTAPIVSYRHPFATAPSSNTTIVNGSVVVETLSSGTASIKGTEGFSLNARLLNGIYPVFGQDLVPGTTVSLHAVWSGLDLPGTVTLRGTTYTVGTANGPGALIALDGSFTAPPQAPTATITAPFTLTGQVEGPDLTWSLALNGRGTATIALQWGAGANMWIATAVQYEIRGR